MNRTRLRPADELVDFTALLVFIQGVVAFVAAVEIGIVTAAMGGLTLVAFLLTGAGAVVTLALPQMLRRRSRRARTTVVILQLFWLSAAVVDLLLAIFLARRGLEPVPTLTRIVLPIAVFRILRRPQVRSAFGVEPSRRERRRARRESHASDAASLTGAAA